MLTGMLWTLVWAILAGPAVFGLLRWTGAVWPALLGYHAGCLVAAGRVRPGFGRRPRWGPLAGMTLASVAVVLVGFAALRSLVPALRAPVGVWTRWGMQRPADLAVLAYYAAANPWIEERFWRGALLSPEMCARLGPGRARGWAILGFVPHHLAVLWPSFGAPLAVGLSISILLAGAFWTELRLRSGHLWWGAASHLGADLGLGLAYVLWLRS
jgi:hypothetical protein